MLLVHYLERHSLLSPPLFFCAHNSLSASRGCGRSASLKHFGFNVSPPAQILTLR